MSKFRVLFDIPAEIEQGLAAGTLQRTGGVVRRTTGKQEIVAWLRETSHVSESTLPPGLESLLGLSVAGQVLNLAVTTATLKIMMQKFDQLSSQIEMLGDAIRAEFKRDRDGQFEDVLRLIQNQYANPDSRHAIYSEAITKLYAAYRNFCAEFDATFETNPLLAHQYLIRAMYASNSCIRCHLDVEEVEVARNDLRQDLQDLEPRVQKLISVVCGENPALFFHKAVERKNLERFIKLRFWLNAADLSTVPLATEEFIKLIDQFRGDFWNTELLKDSSKDLMRYVKLPRMKKEAAKFTFSFDHIDEILNLAEVTLENFERLQSFEMEIRYMRLTGSSFRDWSRLAQEEETSIAFIIPDEAIALEDMA